MAAKKNQKFVNNSDYSVLIKPIVTEKSSLVGEMGSTVTFEVASKATKDEIKQAVENIFDVEVLGVNTMNYRGKVKRRGRQIGMTRSFKKAYITLGPGQAIDLVEGL